MVLGLTYEIGNPDSKSEVYSLVKVFTERFIARYGSITCAELLKYDMSTAEGQMAIREKKLTSIICPRLDWSAAEIVEELLEGRMRNISD